MEYHRHSIRLRGFDYSQEGYYFVTICTYHHECLFGEIVDGKIVLNPLGLIVKHNWIAISNHFKFVRINQYMIMPNHIHGILIVDGVGAGLPRPTSGRGNRAPTLGQMIAYFKYVCAKQIHRIIDNPQLPIWQRNYYEHIIRNEKDYWAIKQYIKDNPKNWERDELFTR